jgi:hypothetical protein
MKGQLSGKQAAFNIEKKAKCCAIYLFFENCWILSGPEPEPQPEPETESKLFQRKNLNRTGTAANHYGYTTLFFRLR